MRVGEHIYISPEAEAEVRGLPGVLQPTFIKASATYRMCTSQELGTEIMKPDLRPGSCGLMQARAIRRHRDEHDAIDLDENVRDDRYGMVCTSIS